MEDPKSGNWRVYLNDGDNRLSVPTRSQPSVSDRSTGAKNRSSTQLSSVLKNKSPAFTDQSPHQVIDYY